MSDDKPKAAPLEFWLFKLDGGYYYHVREVTNVQDNDLHVIEYSYAQALESRCQKLEAGLQEIVRMCNMKISDASVLIAIGINHYLAVAEKALAQDEVSE